VQNEGKIAVLSDMLRNSPTSPFALDLGPRRVFWQLALSGVFDRYPTLKLCLTEIRADWIPATLAELDRMFEAGDFKAKLKPSEYFRQHVWVTPSSPMRSEILDRHAIGLEHFMFGVDYPHSESTWPNTADWIRSAFEGVPEDEVRMILGENALRCYNLPGDKLRAVAASIGLPAADVLRSDRRVPQEIIQHFNGRAGYLREPEKVGRGRASVHGLTSAAAGSYSSCRPMP
jgi:hypothetical protein